MRLRNARLRAASGTRVPRAAPARREAPSTMRQPSVSTAVSRYRPWRFPATRFGELSHSMWNSSSSGVAWNVQPPEVGTESVTAGPL